MRWILVAFVAYVAVAAANLFGDDDYAYDDEHQNNIGIFLPRSLNKGLDKTVRAFYYNYWLYPAMAFRTRVPFADVGPYMDYNYVEPLTFQDVFEKPVIVVTSSQSAPNTFSMFYLHNGLRTLHRYQAFAWLQEFFKHPGLKGLIFYPHLIYNTRFFETPITGVTVQEDLRMSDFVNIENCHSGRIPYMFVAQEDVFDRMHFDNIAKVSDFKVYNDAIEVQPVIAEPRPTYEPFYGPQSPPALQHHVAAPQQQHVAPTHSSGSSVNAMDIRTSSEGYSERPQVVAQSGSLVAFQAGRGVYGEAGYGSVGQYGYGRNTQVSGRYNANYGQRQSGLGQEGYRGVNAGQASSNSYQHSSKTEAHVDADLGARKDVHGTLTGLTSEARFGVVQAGDQVNYHNANQGAGYVKPETEVFSAHGSQVGISRTQEGSFNGQISRVEGTQLSGAQALDVSVQKTDNVMRANPGLSHGPEVSATKESASMVEVSGVHQSVAGSVSRVDSDSGQSPIVYPKEGGLGGTAGVQLQRGASSGVHVESLSRTGAQSEHSTESHVSGRYEVHSSGGSVQTGNVAKTESAKYEGQAGAHGEIASKFNTATISKTDHSEHVTEPQTFTFSSTDSTGKLIRTGGNVGGSIEIQGGTGEKFGLSGNVGSGLLGRFGSGIVNAIDLTTHGLGSELLRHHEGQLGHTEQSGGVSSSTTVTKSVVTTFGPTHSSAKVESESFDVPKPFVSSTRTLVSSARSISGDDMPTIEPAVMLEEA